MTAHADPGADPRTTEHSPGAGRSAPRRSGRGGPPLPLPIAAYAGLTLAGVAVYPSLRPTDDAPTVLAILQASPVLATVSAVLLVAASAPLAVWTAAATHRLQALGARVAGPLIGLVGGVLAAGSLAVSGLVAWTASTAASLGDATLVRALSTLSFAFGGVGFALGSALLLAGVAVPSLILRLVPRWLAIAGIVVAALGAVSVVSLAVPALLPLLPVVRFVGLLVLIGLSVALPVPRRARPALITPRVGARLGGHPGRARRDPHPGLRAAGQRPVPTLDESVTRFEGRPSTSALPAPGLHRRVGGSQ